MRACDRCKTLDSPENKIMTVKMAMYFEDGCKQEHTKDLCDKCHHQVYKDMIALLMATPSSFEFSQTHVKEQKTNSKKGRPPLEKEVVDNVKALHASGESNDAIAEQLGIHRNTVSRVLSVE